MLGLNGTAVFSLLLPACASHAVFNISIFNRPFHTMGTVERLGRLSSNEEFNCKHTEDALGQNAKMHVMHMG